MDGAEIEGLTVNHLPPPFLRALTRSVFLARRSAWDDCAAEFADPEARNLRPYYVRGKLEGLMRDAAERFGLQAEVVREPGQPWNHTEIRSGPVVLTASSVPAPLALPNAADHRRAHAQSNQMRFELLDAPPHDAPLYALLLHSRSYWSTADDYRAWGFLPGSVYLAYPDSALKGYVHSVNLFDMFEDVVRENTPQEWDNEVLLRYVERSRRVVA